MATFDKVQNKSGTAWRFQIAIRGPDGKQRRASGTRTTKAEATIAAAEQEAEIRLELSTGIQRGRTVDDAFRRYEKEVSAAKPGHRWEALRLAAIGRTKIQGVEIRTMLLSDVTSDTLGRWRNLRITGKEQPDGGAPAAASATLSSEADPGNKIRTVKGSTVSRELNLLSHVFSTAAIEWKWIAKSPTTDVRRPKTEESRDRMATDDEIERICFALGFDLGGEEIATETKSQRLAVMHLFAIETAMRSNEICLLESQWVAGNVAHLPAKITKTRKKRDVPLSRRALELLALLPPSVEGETIFGISTDSRDALFRKATKRAMITGLTFHDSRHLAATRLSRKLDVMALARMGGWRDLKQLMVYYNESAKYMASLLDSPVGLETKYDVRSNAESIAPLLE